MNKKVMVFLVTGVSIFIAIIVILIVWIIMNSELNTNRNDKNNRNILNIDANGVMQNNEENSVGTLGNETGDTNKTKFDIKYTNNNLKVNVEEQEVTYENEADQGIGDVIKTVSKFEIAGLKNKTVQDKINNEIKRIIDFYRGQNCIVKIEATANFSDVLSVKIWASNMDKVNPASRSLGLNYRLDNGEKLRLQDLFNANRDVRTAIKESLERKIATYSQDLTKYTTAQKMQGLDIKELAEFDNNKEYEFSFGTKEIDIYNIGQDTDAEDIRNLQIQLSDYADKLAIFTKYVSKEYLYEEESNGNNTSNVTENNQNIAFLNLNKYSSFKKIDETTYVLQNFAGDVNTAIPAEVEKLKNQADYDADRVKKQNTGHKILIQDMLIGNDGQKKTKMITTTVYVVKPAYFESEVFYNDLANASIAQGSYIVDINNDYVVLNTAYTSNEEL